MNDAQIAAKAYREPIDGVCSGQGQMAEDAFLAGATWQREKDARLCESAWGSLSTKAAVDMTAWCARRIREQTKYRQLPGGEYTDAEETP